jgi:hypothetical protein
MIENEECCEEKYCILILVQQLSAQCFELASNFGFHFLMFESSPALFHHYFEAVAEICCEMEARDLSLDELIEVLEDHSQILFEGEPIIFLAYFLLLL